MNSNNTDQDKGGCAGRSWWSSGQDFMLPLQGASLAMELRCHKPCAAKKINK